MVAAALLDIAQEALTAVGCSTFIATTMAYA
jgi:hypothetical protein